MSRTRIAVSLIIVSIAVVCVTVSALFLQYKQMDANLIDRATQARVQQLAQQLALPLKINDYSSIERLVRAAQIAEAAEQVELYSVQLKERVWLGPEYEKKACNTACKKVSVIYDGMTVGYVRYLPHASEVYLLPWLYQMWREILLAALLLCGLLYVIVWHMGRSVRRFITYLSTVDFGSPAIVVPQHMKDDDPIIHKLYEKVGGVLSEISAHNELVRELEVEANIGKMASQVAHDIRSPLTALQAIARNVPDLKEELRIMIRDSVQRIDDIANDLASQKAKTASGELVEHNKTPRVELLSSLISPLISEKRTQHRGRNDVQIEAELGDDTYGLFAEVNAVEFRRVLSNLVNNAVEALGRPGSVTVQLRRDGGHALIQVIDTGKGIPPDVLPKLTQRGVSVGKTGGSGLGLYHARTTVEGWGGSFDLASTVGEGTTITLRLNAALPPKWFVDELRLRTGEPIVILDDDSTIHQVWNGRFAALNLSDQNIQVHSCKNPTQFREIKAQLPHATYLCDYELLGEKATGLDLIDELGIADQAILVSSRYAETNVRQRCAELGVRMIPKGLAGIVPITVAPGTESKSTLETTSTHRHVDTSTQPMAADPSQAQVLVIDDDDAIDFSWKIEQPRLGFGSVQCYSSMESCEEAAIDYTQITHAFLDKNIPNSTWTLTKTIKYLKSKGVGNVVVASGEKREALLADPECVLADDVLALKIPQDDDYFAVI